MSDSDKSGKQQVDIVSIANGLAKIATDEIRHLYLGACPDKLDGHHKRDDECPACQILIQHDEFK